MMLAKFRQRYPQGSLVSELVDIDRGTYIVGVSVIIDNIVLATGLAGADQVEIAEDLARERAIAALMLDNHSVINHNSLISKTKVNQDQPEYSTQVAASPATTAINQHNFSDNEIVELADSPEKSVIKSSEPQPIVSSSNFPADRTITEEANSLQEESIADSTNLFAGTLNSDAGEENFIQEPSQDDFPETYSVEKEQSPQPNPMPEVNFNEIKHQTDLEIKRLGWTKDDGREFLKSRYGKRSRLQLTDNQLLEFLQYLASQPNPS